MTQMDVASHVRPRHPRASAHLGSQWYGRFRHPPGPGSAVPAPRQREESLAPHLARGDGARVLVVGRTEEADGSGRVDVMERERQEDVYVQAVARLAAFDQRCEDRLRAGAPPRLARREGVVIA